MMVTRYLTDGGIPDGWSIENLRWLAKTHRDRATHRWQTHTSRSRSEWHHRWAFLIEDLLESRHVQSH